MSADKRVSLPLQALAHARSGDKGNHANLAVFAYTEEGYAWLCQHLTETRIASYFASYKPRQVVRFLAKNVRGLNFVLYDSLTGGASRSLRSDSQGKAIAQLALQMSIEVPESFAGMLPPGSVVLPSTLPSTDLPETVPE